MIEPIIEGRRQRRHAPGQHRIDAGPDGFAHMMIDVTLIVQVLNVLVISAEANVIHALRRAPARRRNTEAVLSFMLPAMTVIAAPSRTRSSTSSVVVGVVVVADAARKIAPERLVAQPRRVAGDALAGADCRDLLARADHSSRSKGFDSPSVAAFGHCTRASISASRNLGAARFRAPAYAGTRCDTCLKMRSGVSVSPDDVEALGAEHVGNAIRVGQQRRRAAGHGEARQLARRQHRVFDVDVNVDEIGATYWPFASIVFLASNRPGGVTAAICRPADDNIALEDFAGVQQPAPYRRE